MVEADACDRHAERAANGSPGIVCSAKMGGEVGMIVTASTAAGFSRASGVLRKLRGGGRSQKIRWSLAFEAERSLASQAP